MKQVKAKIVSNEQVAPRYYKMRLADRYLADNLKPGQFIEVRCSDGSDPLLRRPFGPHRIFSAKGVFEMLYEVVGRATTALSNKKAGEELDIIGPLGNGFTMAKHAIIVGGGIGIAPLLALAEKMGGGKKSALQVVIGARTKEAILCEKDFKRLGAKVIVMTDDGSYGKKGFTTDALKTLLQTPNSQLLTIYACGPRQMMQAVAELSKEYHVKCQLLLEEYMACGVGVCLGCPVKVRKDLVDHEYKMVCKDGPVFDAERIVW
ncbi:MAG: dihydroorotate dehydrogenase electron transfer subunit [Candidatus Omnitrophica bacterium]|nr:dihydroorotate dehydrogenase electron transfer subunit [Candidatus Omnitrophota bacterium]